MRTLLALTLALTLCACMGREKLSAPAFPPPPADPNRDPGPSQVEWIACLTQNGSRSSQCHSMMPSSFAKQCDINAAELRHWHSWYLKLVATWPKG
jgi:hypothetical protein